ncbi:hypothetical protein AVEN_41909-2 [Araneus ventricosus]|nr:hypothetical protein AVEN_41909-2 [Araneus ventricosus]
MNINESRNMDITNDIHFQNSANKMNNYETMENNRVNKKESFSGMAIGSEVLPFNGQQRTKQRYRRRKENRIEKWLKSNTPSPNATLTVKEEIPEPMNGIGSPPMKNPTDNGPLDLSIKQPISPETKNNEASSAYRLLGGSIRATMNRASSVSPKFGIEESKVTTQKTNRRKGKAFKLNQYTIESDPLSDGAEAELEKMRVFYESTFSNEARSKPAFGSEIKKSIPRINFKPILNTAKWNGHNSHEPAQPEFNQFLPLPKLELYTEPNYADPQTNRQRVRDIYDESWCPHCGTNSGSPRLQELHSSYHSKNDPFTCAKCGLRCNDMIGFNSHIMLGSRINGNCINAIEECKS